MAGAVWPPLYQDSLIYPHEDTANKAIEKDKDNMQIEVFPGEVHDMDGDIVHVTCDNAQHPPFIDHRCDYHYYVTKGSGTFTIDDKTYAVEEGDVIVATSGSTFWYEGNMENRPLHHTNIRSRRSRVRLSNVINDTRNYNMPQEQM